MRHWKRIEAFEKTYKDKRLSFGPLALDSRVVLLVGENGSGKTTLLKCLSGLTRTDTGFMRRGMDYVAGGQSLPGNMRGRAYLDAVQKMAAGDHAVRQGRLTCQFELEAFLDTMVKDCSDGMRQRLALVGGLLQRRRPVLLDEPLRSLDVKYRRRLVEWIAQSGNPFLIATHDPEAYKALDIEIVRL